jgi:hypothetical protein
MEKDGDSEEDNDEEVVKQVVKRRFEGRGFTSHLFPVISSSTSLPLSVFHLHPPY